MCDKARETEAYSQSTKRSRLLADEPMGTAAMSLATEHHTVYELKRQREYHIEQIVKIQHAIDALNKI